MALRIPVNLVSLRAQNAAVVSVADISVEGTYALTTLVLDDNALAPLQQAFSIGNILMLAATLQVFSCQRCGLQLDVELIIRGASISQVNSLQELHLSQVRGRALRCSSKARVRCRRLGHQTLIDT
jgi:hypothetical protein